VDQSTWCDWKNLPEFADLRAKAQARRIIVLQQQMQDAMAKKLDWRAIAWQMERTFKDQFVDPNKVALQLNQSINSGNSTHFSFNNDDLERMRTRLDEIKQREIAWRANRSLATQEPDQHNGHEVRGIETTNSDYPQLAIQDAVEPQQTAPQSESREANGPATQPAAEPHVRWRDRNQKPASGPLSQRQRERLAQERQRRGGEGKTPW
jgi:hypothetical protein